MVGHGVRMWAGLVLAVGGAILVPTGVFLATQVVVGYEVAMGPYGLGLYPTSKPAPLAVIGQFVVAGGALATAAGIILFGAASAGSLSGRVRLGASLIIVGVPILASGIITAAQRWMGSYWVQDVGGGSSSVPVTVASPIAAMGVAVFVLGFAILGTGLATMATVRSPPGKRNH